MYLAAASLQTWHWENPLFFMLTLPPVKSSQTCPGNGLARDQGDSLRLLRLSAPRGQTGGQTEASWAKPGGAAVLPRTRGHQALCSLRNSAMRLCHALAPADPSPPCPRARSWSPVFQSSASLLLLLEMEDPPGRDKKVESGCRISCPFCPPALACAHPRSSTPSQRHRS